VLLLDPATGNTLRAVAADAEDGVYRYEFEALPGGDYEIVTGTDRDNDGTICDAGEACGAYPSLDAVQPVHIDRDRSGLDFETRLILGGP
jgi:serine protease